LLVTNHGTWVRTGENPPAFLGSASAAALFLAAARRPRGRGGGGLGDLGAPGGRRMARGALNDRNHREKMVI